MKTKNCVIFGAGEQPDRYALPQEALLIAADGGREYLNQLGLCPHLTVGDFDSLGYVPEGALVHPKEKDDTDTMLAVKLALERGCERFWIYGGLGGRSDHSFANYATLGYLAQQGALSCLVGKRESVIALGRGALDLPPLEGIVSLFAFGGETQVKLQGLKYEYEGALSPTIPLGVSNEFTRQSARLEVKEGILLIFLQASPETLVRLLEENHE